LGQCLVVLAARIRQRGELRGIEQGWRGGITPAAAAEHVEVVQRTATASARSVAAATRLHEVAHVRLWKGIVLARSKLYVERMV